MVKKILKGLKMNYLREILGTTIFLLNLIFNEIFLTENRSLL